MLLLISLLLVLPFALYGKDFIKKHSKVLYVLSAIISVGVVYGVQTKAMLQFPTWLRTYVWDLFANGALASAMFIVVMFLGALSRESSIRKKLMPIRAELSIIASILTLGHNVAYGISYFVFLFKTPNILPLNQLLASVVSLVMIVIMLPLFITSFYSIRKKMNGKSWKNLQKLAYVFYAFMYLHVLLLAIPYALKGRSGYLLMTIVYSVIFCAYFAMRVSKAMASSSKGTKMGLWLLASVACVFAILLSMPNVIIKTEEQVPVGLAQQDSSSDVQNDSEKDTVLSEKEADETEKVEEKEGEDLSTAPNGSAQDDSKSAKDSAQDDNKEVEGSAQDDKKDTKVEEKKEPVEEKKEPVAEEKEDKDPSTAPNGSVQDDSKSANGSAQDESKSAKGSAQDESKSAKGSAQDGKKDVQNDSKDVKVEEKKQVEEVKKAPVEEKKSPVEEKKEETAPKPQAEPEVQPEPEPQKVYNDGTYTGTGQGYNGAVVVNVVIANDAIVQVYVVSHAEDEPYWTQCMGMLQRIVAAQSANVQTVSGATVSAEAIRSGAAAAINSAKR